MRNDWQAEAWNLREIKTLFSPIWFVLKSCQTLAVPPGYSNRRVPRSSLSFYRIPSGDSEKEKEHRLKWLNAIHRGKWYEEETRNVRLCSVRFVSVTRLLASYVAVSCCICFIKATTCQSPFKTWIYYITLHLFFFSREPFFKSSGPWLCTDNLSANYTEARV